LPPSRQLPSRLVVSTSKARQTTTMAIAYAHTNIALIKYWGKRRGDDARLNLPAVGSLSMTLDRFGTHTEVRHADDDAFWLNGERIEGEDSVRVFRFVNVMRTRAATQQRVHVVSRNDVPTAAGLASSASAFAALALAGSSAFGLPVDAATVSSLARQGSGSAARSLHGGFVQLACGQRDDGADCIASPVAGANHMNVAMVVVRCGEGKKATGSTVGMDHTAQTSPYFAPWVATHDADLRAATAAIARVDLAGLGEVMEHSTLKMHATTLAARPGFFYFQPTTIAVLQAVWALRKAGQGAWATMDAGPHVKVLCATHDAAGIAQQLQQVDGVRGVEVAGVGPAARLVTA
jgi:diphosphomevalonate decarboxylase